MGRRKNLPGIKLYISIDELDITLK
jgi:hypothetical protein